MATGGHKAFFDKLNGENYFVWKYRMEHFLKREKLWKVISTNPVPTFDEANTDEEDAWKESDEMALSWLVALVDDSQLGYVRDRKTAIDAWTALRNQHEKANMSNRVTIIRQICGKRLSEDDNIEQRMAEFIELFQRLNDLGDKAEDSWKIAMLFSTLPPSYDPLVSALEARADDELTFSMVVQKLIAEYKRRLERGDVKAADSVLRTVGAPTASKSSRETTCYFCKGTGHMKKDCPKYKSWKKKKDDAADNQKANTVQESKDEFLFAISNGGKADWIVDSGATCHVACDKRWFVAMDAASSDLTVANGQKILVEGKGTCQVEFVNASGGVSSAKLTDVLYSPAIKGNLLSVRKLIEKGFAVNFIKNGCEIRRQNQQIAIADDSSGLYKLRQPHKAYTMVCEHKANCIHNLHRVFGHRDPAAIKEMCSKGMIDGITIDECGIKQQCEVCLKAKLTRLPFPKQSMSKSNKALDLIHTDVCGPMQTTSPSGKRYILTMIDDFSRYTTIYLLKEKSEVEGKIKEYVAMVENKFMYKPKVMRSDRGGEYIGASKYVKERGIQIQYTAPYTPEQNGVAERKNRTLVEMARCMLVDADLPYSFWAEAVNTANYLQNRLPSRSVGATPYELWNGNKPRLDKCAVFGSRCYVHVPTEKRRKLDNTGKEMIFVGYDENSKAYRCFDRTDRKLVISRDVKFIRQESSNLPMDELFTERASTEVNEQPQAVIDEEQLVDADASLEQSDSEYESFVNDSVGEGVEERDRTIVNQQVPHTEQPRRSQRSNKGVPPNRLIEEINVIEEKIIEPRSFAEAIRSKQAVEWKRAMEDEMDSLKRNGTWTFCSLPEGRTAIGCKWVFKLKTGEDGKIKRFKARLVAQGFSQKFGTDYDQVYAPVARQATFRTLLAIASSENYLVRHMDAKTAFLNGILKETIFMKQPPGFMVDNGMVCLLKRSLYGLKQAAKSWNDAIHEVLVSAEFIQSKADACLYLRKLNGDWSYLLIYVDDIVVVTKSIKSANQVKDIIASKFDLEDLGEIKFYLGMEISKSSDGFYQLCQSAYIDKVASDFGLADAKDSKVPMGAGYGKASGDENEVLLLDNNKYQSLIGCLLYISVNSRPDITASVSILAQRVSTPRQEDWHELKRVVRYLKATSKLRLVLGDTHNANKVIGYADASWAEHYSDRKSNSGYVFIVNGGTVSWACRKQKCVALSSTEAEFIALSEACQEAHWLVRLLADMQRPLNTPILIYEDNQSCLKMIGDERLSNRTKHIDTRYNFVKDYIEKKIVSCTYCPTERMLADLFTKPLPATKHIELRECCGLK